jgi:acyl-CoA reductase-like NAD-dependent aldehyde dehydrogenase
MMSEYSRALNHDDGRSMTIPEIGEQNLVDQAAKEVDSERREVEEVIGSMRARQAYFHEKAQMFRESADHYQRMSEDIAELLNNDYTNKKPISDDHRRGNVAR